MECSYVTACTCDHLPELCGQTFVNSVCMSCKTVYSIIVTIIFFVRILHAVRNIHAMATDLNAIHHKDYTKITLFH